MSDDEGCVDIFISMYVCRLAASDNVWGMCLWAEWVTRALVDVIISGASVAHHNTHLSCHSITPKLWAGIVCLLKVAAASLGTQEFFNNNCWHDN